MQKLTELKHFIFVKSINQLKVLKVTFSYCALEASYMSDNFLLYHSFENVSKMIQK